MSEEWQIQLRIYVTEEMAAVLRHDADDPAIQPLIEILHQHRATLVSQFDAFEAYVRQAEQEGPDKFPLYKWTKATLDDPAKRAKHMTAFAIRIDDNEVYPKAAADALQAAIDPMTGGGLVLRMSRHDTNPANNLPVPPEYRSWLPPGP